MPALLYEKKGYIAYITINRPEVHNAMDAEVIVRLAEAWQDFAADHSLRVAIVTGAGDKAFSAGGDLRKIEPLLLSLRAPENEWEHQLLASGSLPGSPLPQLSEVAMLWRGIELYKPIIAAINGLSLAGGTVLALSCDIRIAAEHATLGITEVKWGLPPGPGIARLPWQVPFCKAMEILLVGNLISAEEALRMGLVNYVVPADRLMQTAEDFARRIADNGPLAVQKTKEVVLKGAGRPLEETYVLEDEAIRFLLGTEDVREGIRAFAEKCAPRFLSR